MGSTTTYTLLIRERQLHIGDSGLIQLNISNSLICPRTSHPRMIDAIDTHANELNLSPRVCGLYTLPCLCFNTSENPISLNTWATSCRYSDVVFSIALRGRV